MNYEKLYTYLILYSFLACISILAVLFIFLINFYEKNKSKKLYIQKYKKLMLKYENYIKKRRSD